MNIRQRSRQTEVSAPLPGIQVRSGPQHPEKLRGVVLGSFERLCSGLYEVHAVRGGVATKLAGEHPWERVLSLLPSPADALKRVATRGA